MEKYRVILATRVRSQLLNHITFLSRVSPHAARRLRFSFEEIKERIKENPFQFPSDHVLSNLNLPYRSALFEGRYKALFTVEGHDVFIDSVIDCRQQNESDSSN